MSEMSESELVWRRGCYGCGDVHGITPLCGGDGGTQMVLDPDRKLPGWTNLTVADFLAVLDREVSP